MFPLPNWARNSLPLVLFGACLIPRQYLSERYFMLFLVGLAIVSAIDFFKYQLPSKNKKDENFEDYSI